MGEGHYGASYFAWQSAVGDVGGVLNQPKFRPWIKPDDVVLDFGCGNGALLAALPGVRKIGIEVGSQARKAAKARGLEVHASLADVAESSVDVAISNHALEHAERPLDELRGLCRTLRPGGTAVLVVPIDDWRRQQRPQPSDPNHHLYTWTPLLFANLLADAGLAVESCSVLSHAWRRKFLILHQALPRPIYNAAAWTLAVTTRSRQIHAVAHRPH